MKVVFLYGPPAVGKLTIAKILEQETRYKLLHNHLLQNSISEVFLHENSANRLLVREFRLRILEEAVTSNINLITTFGIAGNNPFGHIDDVLSTIEANKSEVCLVHLTADEETIVKRVEDQSRKDHGKNLSKEKLEELLRENPYMLNKYAKKEHLTINTAEKNPEDAVEEIIVYYKLGIVSENELT